MVVKKRWGREKSSRKDEGEETKVIGGGGGRMRRWKIRTDAQEVGGGEKVPW